MVRKSIVLKILALAFNVHRETSKLAKKFDLYNFFNIYVLLRNEMLKCSPSMNFSENDQICSKADSEKRFTQPRYQIKSYEFLLLLNYDT